MIYPKTSWLLAVLLVLLSLLYAGCLKIDNTFSKIPPGPWRAVLQLEPTLVTPNPKGKPLDDKLNLTFEEVANGELPFTFEVTYTDDTTFYIDLINGEERVRVPSEDISFGHTRADVKDTIRIDFPVHDTYLTGRYENGLIEGYWVVNYREEYQIPFVARFGKNHRFTKLRKPPVADISGKWAVTFGLDEDEDPYPAIGEFVQDSNRVTGTFRTETGDYRFLEGTIQEDKLYLSVFDGSHGFLFEAKVDASGDKMVGYFRSGTHYRTIWEATRDEEARLADPNSLTTVVGPDKSLNFTLPNSLGELVSLSDSAFSGKVKVVQLMGSWCPNSLDATKFLLRYLAENPHPDLQVVAVGFERYRAKDQVLATLQRYREELDIPYPVLWGGYFDKSEASAAFPALSQVLAYPTFLFVDRDNRVQVVYTGFNGPATSEYAALKQWFAATLGQMLDPENMQ